MELPEIGKEVERLAQVRDPERGPALQPALGVLQHPSADVEAEDVGTALGKPRRVGAGATPGIEHPLAVERWQERQHGRAVIVGVVRLVLDLSGVRCLEFSAG